jgi:hypothetical protein
MDTSNRYLGVVHDALYARDMKYEYCFAFNKASEKVQTIGTPILPVLEHVLHDEVMPHCPLDPKAQHQEFPGIGVLLVDYFSIAKDGQMERAAKFFSSLGGPVLIEAIRAVSIVWDHMIPDAFLPSIEKIARTGSSEEREIALWSLDWHLNKPQREKELADADKEMGISTGKE